MHGIINIILRASSLAAIRQERFTFMHGIINIILRASSCRSYLEDKKIDCES